MTTLEGAFTPPESLEDFFAGSWSYLRILDDRRLGTRGSILGHAGFEAAEAALLYSERGHLSFAGSETIATRRYRYSFPEGQRAEVFFADGRPFHAMDLSRGEDYFTHDCPPDLYQGHCRLLDASSWQLSWRVTGPRKDLRLKTRYRRFADPQGCFRPLADRIY